MPKTESPSTRISNWLASKECPYEPPTALGIAANIGMLVGAVPAGLITLPLSVPFGLGALYHKAKEEDVMVVRNDPSALSVRDHHRSMRNFCSGMAKGLAAAPFLGPGMGLMRGVVYPIAYGAATLLSSLESKPKA